MAGAGSSVGRDAAAGWWAARSKSGRLAAGVLLTAVTILLTVVIVTPVALSAQDLIDWAAAPSGLNLPKPWPLLVFLALDAAAAACVLLTVYCAWRGEPAGVFGLLVWCFATASAFANWRHAHAPGAAPDAIWFFPTMSLAGPALLEAVLGRFRRWAQRDHGRRHRRLPAYGWRRWTPGLGALRDTYGAYRTALLTGIDTVEDSITAYHRLCPDGNLRIATALRNHTNHNRRQETEPAENEPAPPEPATLPVDLMRRIPIQPEAYQRWRTAWAQLRHNPFRSGEADPHSSSRHFANTQTEDPPIDGPPGSARHAGDPLVDADDPVSDNGGSAVRGPTAASLPAALMRRIPVRPDAYRRWLAVWDELRGDAGDLAAVAGRHGFSVRQVEFIRRAGQAHLLDSDLPPALRAASNGHRPPAADADMAKSTN